MSATELTFTSASLTLAGTLLGPESPADRAQPRPAALLISGSGPIDRDSNMRKLRIDVMGQLARHLAAAGVVSFRYDKRGVGASAGDYQATGFHDNVADAAAALETLRSRPEVDPDRVVVIGHSEGAVIATELAADVPDLAGTVLLAGMATAGREVLEWQGAQVAATLPRPVAALLRLLRLDLVKTQQKRLDQLAATTGDTVRIQMVKLNARWFREFLAHDPTPSLRRITTPVLALTGSKDLQIPPADVERIAELVPGPCRHEVVPGLTHLLRRELGEPSLRTYKKQAKQPIDGDLVDRILDWTAQVTAPVTAVCEG